MAQKLTDAQRTMVEKNLPMVTWYIQNKVPYWKRDEYDDLFQIGALGLCNAAANYDEAQGVKFSSYAYHYIAGEIWHYLQRERRIRKQYGAARLEDTVLGEEITLAHQIPAVETGKTLERMLILRDELERLGPMDRRCMKMHISGFLQNEIAHRLCISQPTVRRCIRHARERLRKVDYG